jgi:hypothetical protein
MYEPKQYPYLRPDIVAAEVAAINWQHLEVPGAADMDCGGTTAAALSANSSGGAPALVPFFSNLQNLRVGLSGLQVCVVLTVCWRVGLLGSIQPPFNAPCMLQKESIQA